VRAHPLPTRTQPQSNTLLSSGPIIHSGSFIVVSASAVKAEKQVYQHQEHGDADGHGSFVQAHVGEVGTTNSIGRALIVHRKFLEI
jgi:hypothetical protein